METSMARSHGAANAPLMETSTGLPMVRPMRLPWKHPRASPWFGQCASHGNIHGLPHGSANAPPMETSTGFPMVRPMRLPMETATALSHGNGPVTYQGNGTGSAPFWIQVWSLLYSPFLALTQSPYMDASRPAHAGQGNARAVYGAARHRPRSCLGLGQVNSPARAAYALSWQRPVKSVM